MRAERELMRGAGPVAVLKLLGEGPMYGYQLGEALARRSAGVPYVESSGVIVMTGRGRESAVCRSMSTPSMSSVSA